MTTIVPRKRPPVGKVVATPTDPTRTITAACDSGDCERCTGWVWAVNALTLAERRKMPAWPCGHDCHPPFPPVP